MDRTYICHNCSSKMTYREDFTFTYHDKVVTGIKGWICDKCKEVIYPGDEVKRIEREIGA